MVLAMPWDDPAVAALAAARKQQCFLKLFGLACPECFGVSNLAKQCLVSGLHHCQSEIKREEPIIKDGASRRDTAVENASAAEDAAAGRSIEGTGPRLMEPDTTTWPITAGLARKMMAAALRRENYETVDPSEVAPYDKELEIEWTMSGRTHWHAICVRPREKGDKAGMVRIHFPDDESDAPLSAEDWADSNLRVRLGSRPLPAKWWTHEFFRDHPLTNFRLCQHGIDNLKQVQESQVDWPASWGKDHSWYGLRRASTADAVAAVHAHPASAFARENRKTPSTHDRCNYCARTQKQIPARELKGNKLSHDKAEFGTYRCSAGVRGHDCRNKSGREHFHASMKRLTIGEQAADLRKVAAAAVAAVPPPTPAKSQSLAVPSTAAKGTATPSPSLLSTPGGHCAQFTAATLLGKEPAKGKVGAVERPEDKHILRLELPLPAGLQKAVVSVTKAFVFSLMS